MKIEECLKCGNTIYSTTTDNKNSNSNPNLNLNSNKIYSEIHKNCMTLKVYVVYCDICMLKVIDEVNVLEFRQRVLERLDAIENKIETLIHNKKEYIDELK